MATHRTKEAITESRVVWGTTGWCCEKHVNSIAWQGVRTRTPLPPPYPLSCHFTQAPRSFWAQ